MKACSNRFMVDAYRLANSTHSYNIHIFSFFRLLHFPVSRLWGGVSDET